MMKEYLIYLLGAIAIQLVTGNVDVSWTAFPVGAGVGAALLALLYVVDCEWGSSACVVRWRSPRMACIILVPLLVWCVMGGCLPQSAAGEADGFLSVCLHRLGLFDFPTSWPFVAQLVALLVHLTLLLLHRIRRCAWRRDAPFLLLHVGVWLTLLAGMVGAGDVSQYRTVVRRDVASNTAYDMQGRVTLLPYELTLQDFEVTVNGEDGSPVQYAATFLLDGIPSTLAVNAPHAVSLAEDIYLMSFDRGEEGDTIDRCVLQIVRQPWKYPMLAGLLMLLCGAGWMMVKLK
ncbi:MAG: cytochrome c biogenesis protein ResB [Mediterranea sp.]|nr:cytochrome c biogenesis protein ResB [Mediterranea sp.]